MSVSSASSSNPFSLQALWQQTQSQGSASAQTDPLSQLLASMGRQSAGASASAASGAATGVSSSPGNSYTQFSPQTLQALLALQSSGNGSSALTSQFAAGGPSDASGTGAAQTQGQHGHHRHHAAGANGQSVEQLMQMQAQLQNPATTQNIATV